MPIPMLIRGLDEVDIREKIAGQIGLHLLVTRHLLHASSCSCGHVTPRQPTTGRGGECGRLARQIAAVDALAYGFQIG